MTNKITDQQIEAYLNSCNRLLSTRMAVAEDQQIVDLAERIHGGKPIGLEIYGDDPDRPCHHLTVRFANGRFELHPDSGEQPHAVWKISRDRLIEISATSEFPSRDTENTDWNCLVSRLGLGANALDEPTCHSAGDEAPGQNVANRYEELIHEIQLEQSDLVTSTRMRCLSDFVSAVAHEVNTPLGVITSSGDAMRRTSDRIRKVIADARSIEELRDNDRLEHLLHILKDNSEVNRLAGERIGRLVKRLKRFAHLDEADIQRVNLNDELENAVGLLENQFGERVVFKREFGELPPVLCSPGKMNEAFISLIRNAAQAIDGAGRVTVTTSASADTIYIVIADNGRGIPDEKRRHLFDFVFTRKDSRVQVQTGLATSYSIIRAHEGDLSISSEPGKGTRVMISLPIQLREQQTQK